MAISGGGDRSLLRPLRQDGNVDHDLDHVVIGNHKGEYSGFNIVDPAPGSVHQFGTRRELLAARQRGWWVADPERDGRPAYEMMALYRTDRPSDEGDGPFSEYVHLVTSEENFRRLQEEKLAMAKAQLADGGMGYLENVSGEEYDTGRSPTGQRHTRFATNQHGTWVQEGDEVREHLTPHGILREGDI